MTRYAGLTKLDTGESQCPLCDTRRTVTTRGEYLFPCTCEWERRARVQPWHLHPRWLDPVYWGETMPRLVAEEDAERERRRVTRAARKAAKEAQNGHQ